MKHDIVFDADFATKFAAISTRSLWTIDELVKASEETDWRDYEKNVSEAGWGIPDETRDAFDYYADMEELARDNFLDR